MLFDLYPIYEFGPGTWQDHAQRIMDLIPDSWVGDTAKLRGTGVLASVAQGVGMLTFQNYFAARYQQLQTRIATATDTNLDLISADLFGGTLPRLPNELDNAYRVRIQQHISPQATRFGMQLALQYLSNLLNFTFAIVEDGNTYDCMSLGTYGGLGTLGALGGALVGPGDVYITIFYRPPNVTSIIQTTIYAAINACKPEGITCFVAFVQHP